MRHLVLAPVHRCITQSAAHMHAIIQKLGLAKRVRLVLVSVFAKRPPGLRAASFVSFNSRK
ncbi:hypothetical protein SVAN01_06777 [Stagonosporopsis vannaccii]|nr:hypothetical protein SVAN01_06777 [Stagonosporopsis vannaccii]